MRLLLILLVALATLRVSTATSSAPPNILMIAVDDLNNWITPWRSLADTPNIARLAREGVLFRNAHCVTPACNPSRVALLTGLRPETTGQFSNDGNFRKLRPGNENIVTLPQYLRGLGYHAIAAGKIFHHPRGRETEARELSDPESWSHQWAGPTGTPTDPIYKNADGFPIWHGGDPALAGNGHTYAATQLYWGPIDTPKEDTGDWKTASYAADYVSKKHGRPFFFACGIFRPHSPQLAPREYFEKYPLDSIELPETPHNDMDDIPEAWRENWSTPVTRLMKEKGEWKKAVQGYLAASSFADDCVGRVLDALRDGPNADNTIVIFWGDHGWHLGTKDRWEKFSLWFEATNAPLIIRAPGFEAGESSRAVSFLDLYPTVAELLDQPIPPQSEGTSLLPLLHDPAAPRETPAVVTYPEGSHAVIHEQWQYIHYKDGGEELYDHANDPLEFENLIDATAVQDIAQRMRDWLPTQ